LTKLAALWSEKKGESCGRKEGSKRTHKTAVIAKEKNSAGEEEINNTPLV